jgi:hypothetical protein
VPGSRVTFAPDAGPDTRNYRVSSEKIMTTLPAFQPVWTVRLGIDELYAAFARYHLTYEEFTGPRLLRIRRVRDLMERGELDDGLRWRTTEMASGGGTGV